MEHPRKLVFTTRIPIRWGDMDAMGHVNNTMYFRSIPLPDAMRRLAADE